MKSFSLNLRHRNVIALTLFLVGLLQMIGYLSGHRALRGIGLASGIAPFPKVFCESDGYEPFAARFAIEATDAQGKTQTMPLTAERYAGLQGPYQRRNVIGAALAYGPRLPDKLRERLYTQMMNVDSPLREELGIPETWRDLHVRITAGGEGAPTEWLYPLTPQHL